jgi:ubiquinone/menaquinone biosynthesis C-methylase UbiE
MPTSDPPSAPKSAPKNAWAVSLLFRIWSRFYDSRLPQRLYYRRIHHRIARRWQPVSGERVLDVGCGTGLFLKSLAGEHAEKPQLALTGLDLSEHMLDQARRTGPSLGKPPTFVQGSVYAMPFADGAFDVIVNTISCHFYLEQVRAFREILRVLAPGGRFFCAAITFGPFSATMPGVAAYFPPRVLEAHLREAGFDVVGSERIRPGSVLFEATKPFG